MAGHYLVPLASFYLLRPPPRAYRVLAWPGLQGGFNTVHHSHLDLGTFVLEMGGVRWAVELGKVRARVRTYM